MSASNLFRPLIPEVQALASRIEEGRPVGYWEQNLVLGRRAAFSQALEWMEPLHGRRVACLGLAERERVELTGRCERAEEWDRTSDPRPIDDVVLWEVLERLDAERRQSLLGAIEESGATRLFVALRVESAWSRLAAGSSTAALPVGDPIQLLRAIHLDTDLRFERQQTLKRRNSVLQLIELRRPESAK